MRDVVALRIAVAADVRRRALGLADEAAVCGECRRRRRLEAALEEAPRDPARVQKVADIATGHPHVVAGRAIVEERLRIADDGAGYRVGPKRGLQIGWDHPTRLPRNQIQSAGTRRAER